MLTEKGGTDAGQDRPRNAPCDHTPTQITVFASGSGYKVQCLICGLIGPERDSPSEAWKAMKRLRYRGSRSGEAELGI